MMPIFGGGLQIILRLFYEMCVVKYSHSICETYCCVHDASVSSWCIIEINKFCIHLFKMRDS